MNKLPFAILRAGKIKSFGELAAMQSHCLRTRPTPNANAKYTHLNRTYGADGDLCEVVKQILTTNNVKIRRNGVLAIELVLSFSPEFIKNEDGSLKSDANALYRRWRKLTQQWLAERFGTNHIRTFEHFDEQSPHFHAIIIPLEKRTNKAGDVIHKLNARGITGGRDKLQALQTSYATAVSSVGLKRGVKGSTAKHTTVKQYYAALKQSNQLCKQTGLTPPTSNPLSFNHWQYVVSKLAKSLDESHESELMALRNIIAELVETNSRLNEALSRQNRPHIR
ncbi:MobV family relaxase [Colwellia sp. MEBiC06753]